MKINCLRNNNQIRSFILAALIFVSFLMIVSACATEKSVAIQNNKAQQVKYPPYPDVWGLELPVSEGTNYAGIDVVKMPDGDFMITLSKERIKAEEGKKGTGWLLFSCKNFEIGENYKDFYRKMFKEKKIIRSLLLVKSSILQQFSDGSGMKIVWETHPKYDLPFDSYLERQDKNGKILIQKKLLYLYDKPVKKETPMLEKNFDYKGKYYYEKVNWPSELRYVPLEDDSFLIIGFLQYQSPPSIIIIRFDKDFKTKSDLLNKKIFLVGEKVYRDQLPLNDQQANDFFYNYLTK